MLLHKKRLAGNLNGIGYQNPYAGDRTDPVFVQPLSISEYKNSLILTQEHYVDENKTQEKRELRETLQSFDQQEGQGIISTATTLAALYQGIKTVAGSYSSETGTKIKNFYGKYINPHENFRPGFVGERHMILNGTVASYAGPGTNLRARMLRNDPPLDGPNGIDAQARIHDVQYATAKTTDDVRDADIKFLKNIDQSTGGWTSKKIINTAMKAKMKAEDFGLIDKNKYSKIADNADTPMVGTGITHRLKKTKKSGKYPDSNLRNKLLKQYTKSKRKLINKIE